MPLWYVTQHNRPTPPTFLIEVNFKSVRMRSQVPDKYNNMHLKFKLRSILSPFEHVSGALSESMLIQQTFSGSKDRLPPLFRTRS